jgi:hypothetical protein
MVHKSLTILSVGSGVNRRAQRLVWALGQIRESCQLRGQSLWYVDHTGDRGSPITLSSQCWTLMIGEPAIKRWCPISRPARPEARSEMSCWATSFERAVQYRSDQLTMSGLAAEHFPVYRPQR